MKIEDTVGELLKKKGLSISIAESCTGGLLGYLITNVPGSSKYFKGGIVAYSDQLKEKFLYIPKESIEKFGSVSPEVAKSMAEEIRKNGEADLGLAITGIAGPGGGSKMKPAGLVYIALATPDVTEWQSFHFSGDRKSIRSQSARKALYILRDYLKKI
jgi:PncC family amidohydrolase